MAGADHHPDLPNSGVGEEGFDRVAQHRFAAKHLILLGQITAMAATGPGGDDKNRDCQTRTPTMLHCRKFLATLAQ